MHPTQAAPWARRMTRTISPSGSTPGDKRKRGQPPLDLHMRRVVLLALLVLGPRVSSSSSSALFSTSDAPPLRHPSPHRQSKAEVRRT
ncbi:hypothetical protein B0H16DRAFT_1732449 [Mycena metata]|uniref:Uncharacterized protein n=1 Tax=Mycena metata TaxID=1033252 RepID=A0AAD7I1R4_9AGAR|nr:hypothetical protein B0H16DRAFT_1732449 [Mycena metata]